VKGATTFIKSLERIAAKQMPKGVTHHIAGSPALDKAFMGAAF
jgi:hypothetical protein